MKMIRYERDTDGFHGVYYPNEEKPSHKGMIVMLGDDSEDHLVKCGARYFHDLSCNVMALSAGKKDYGYHSWPLEEIVRAIEVMKQEGNDAFGIVGISTTGMIALTAASLIPDLTLTIAMSASDFVMQGFIRDGKDGAQERPAEGESTLTWANVGLPYLPYAFAHPDYWQVLKQEARDTGNMAAARILFDESEFRCPLREEMMIKVEDIKGHVMLIGAEDDALWDTCRYSRRILKRLQARKHECTVEALLYEHGTHFVIPQGMMKYVLPVGADLLLPKLFPAAKGHTKEIRRNRRLIDQAVQKAVAAWGEQA